MSKMQVDLTLPFDTLMEDADNIITSAHGEMDYFPLCCSTGVLKDVSAMLLKKHNQPQLEKAPNINSVEIRRKVVEAKYIHLIINAVRGMGAAAPMPRKYAHWHCMSLMHAKCHEGLDNRVSDGYSGFKASQIVMFDRTLEDKDPKKGFKFSYNMVYGTDHTMRWLMERGHELGEILVSTPQPGAHGAEVYGCIFTPDKSALKKYHDDRIQEVKDHFLAVLDHHYPIAEPAEDAPEQRDGFVSY